MTVFVGALLVFLFPLAYSPGPGNMFFAAMGARSGVAATLPANAGYHLATLLLTGLVGAGVVVVVLDPASNLFSLMKTAGSVYVLWLAWKMASAGRSNADVQNSGAGFFDGAVLLVLNPKAYVIILLVYSQFAGFHFASAGERVAIISLVFTVNNLLAFLLWMLAGDGLGRMFRSEISARRLNLFFASMLAVVALWMLLG